MTTIQTKHIIRIALGTAIILLIPLVATLISDEVRWGPADFVFGGVLLIGAGLAYELVASKVSATGHRVTAAVVIAIVVLLIWAELAVGLFGTPFAGS